ncbi:hypothetical protein ACFLZM_08305 [Thermodesulfobacteriota bacterium]
MNRSKGNDEMSSSSQKKKDSEKIPRVFLTDEDTANFSCPKCNAYRELNVSKYKKIEKSVRLKYKCQCGHSYSVILERRQGGLRKDTELFGEYTYIRSGQAVFKRSLIVKDVSKSGIRFQMYQPNVNVIQHGLSSGTDVSVDQETSKDITLQVGDQVLIEFRLNDTKKSMIKENGVVRWISGSLVGAQFTDKNPDPALGFYMWN